MTVVGAGLKGGRNPSDNGRRVHYRVSAKANTRKIINVVVVVRCAVGGVPQNKTVDHFAFRAVDRGLLGVISIIAILGEDLDQQFDTVDYFGYYCKLQGAICDIFKKDPIVSRTRAEIGALMLLAGEEVFRDRNFDWSGYSLCDHKEILAGFK
jgi:hypothetical protein